jgi:hypothetical protein
VVWWIGEVESVTVTVKFDVPEAEGVPVITPVGEVRVAHPGSEPPLTL